MLAIYTDAPTPGDAENFLEWPNVIETQKLFSISLIPVISFHKAFHYSVSKIWPHSTL